jgi:inositol transport system ATP-binding protein
MSDEQNHFVLEMRGITKSFPGVLALDKVNLKVREGSVHVLVGENGAGKSTLMKVLSGEHAIDSGEIWFKGEKLDNQDTKAALEMGISMIHQELSPVLDMTIAENIYLGREPVVEGNPLLTPFKTFVDFRRMYDETQQLLDKLGLKYDPRQQMRELSIAAMQLIEITKAISRQASLIIMDEPTSAISDTEVEMLFKQIADLKQHGVAIIYITHKMDEIFQIADDITIIRDGQYVDSNVASAYDENKLISLMVGRTISNIFPKEHAEIGETVLELKNVTRTASSSNVSFSVRKGRNPWPLRPRRCRAYRSRARHLRTRPDRRRRDLPRRPADQAQDLVRCHRPRHRHGLRRPQGRRPRALSLGQGKHLARQPQEVRPEPAARFRQGADEGMRMREMLRIKTPSLMTAAGNL